MVKALALLVLFSAATALAQDYPPPRLRNEGSLLGPYYSLDCVGPAVNCTMSAGQSTLTVDVESGDISNLSASDKQILFRDGSGISGDADLTWDKTTNALTTASSATIQTGYIGLAGTTPSNSAGIFLAGTSSTLLGPLLSNFTYTGTSTVAASLQSELAHEGLAVSPYVWGALVSAWAGSDNFGINQYWGLAANAGYIDNTEICDAGEYCVFYGSQFSVLSSSRVGGSHHASSTNIAIGAYIPAFTTPSGGAFIRHGFLLGEPMNLTAGTKIGFDADVFVTPDTLAYYDSGSSELRFEINGTERLAMTSTGIGFHGVTPIARPSAYTQTYSTASRTMPALTSSAVSATAIKENGSAWCFTSESEIDDLIAAINALRTDVDNGKKVTNQILDDLQAYGLLQ